MKMIQCLHQLLGRGRECEENKEVSVFIKALDKGEEDTQLERTNHRDRKRERNEAVDGVKRRNLMMEEQRYNMVD